MGSGTPSVWGVGGGPFRRVGLGTLRRASAAAAVPGDATPFLRSRVHRTTPYCPAPFPPLWTPQPYTAQHRPHPTGSPGLPRRFRPHTGSLRCHPRSAPSPGSSSSHCVVKWPLFRRPRNWGSQSWRENSSFTHRKSACYLGVQRQVKRKRSLGQTQALWSPAHDPLGPPEGHPPTIPVWAIVPAAVHLRMRSGQGAGGRGRAGWTHQETMLW